MRQSPVHNPSIPSSSFQFLAVLSYIGYHDTIQLNAAVANIATIPSTTMHTAISPIETTELSRNKQFKFNFW